MEFRDVIASRRSVRFFEAERPVAREKIQRILEAALLASRAVNVPWGKAIVVYRDQLTRAERDSLKTPFASAEFELAPVWLLWYHDMDARRVAIEGSRWPAVASGALQDIVALGPPHGWSRKYVEEVVLPEVLTPGLAGPPQRGGNPDASLALEQAYLAAVDEGLTGCLVPFDEGAAAGLFGVPETWEPLLALLLGHSVESPEAGGQRPRPAWETMFFDGNIATPFPRDPAVAARTTQMSAPLPWRAEEVRALSRGAGLPGGGLEEDRWHRDPPRGPVSAALRESPTVRQWLASYQQFWRSGPPPEEALVALERFLAFCEATPEAIVGEVLKPKASGEGLLLRTRARRAAVERIAAFEEAEGSRRAANWVRSFLIHNGIAMSPAILR